MRKKIWIIDDDPVIGNILSDHLRTFFDYEPYYFSNAKDAYKMLKKLRPDLILLDWVMPDQDGMEIIDTLKGQTKTANIPIFMITGRSSGEEFESACSKGIDGYFTKPIDYTRISRRLSLFFQQQETL